MAVVIQVFACRLHLRPLLVVEEIIRVVLGGRRGLVIFATLSSRMMSGGVIPASTDRTVVSVGRMHPVIIRIVSFIICIVSFVQLFSVGVAAPDR